MTTRASFVLIFLVLLPGHGNTQPQTVPVTPSGPYPPPAALERDVVAEQRQLATA